MPLEFERRRVVTRPSNWTKSASHSTLVLLFLRLPDHSFEFVFVLGVEHANADTEDADEELWGGEGWRRMKRLVERSQERQMPIDQKTRTRTSSITRSMGTDSNTIKLMNS